MDEKWLLAGFIFVGIAIFGGIAVESYLDAQVEIARIEAGCVEAAE